MNEGDVLGIVVAHGTMAEGLVSAVRKIAGGAADGLYALSNDGKNTDELRTELNRLAGDSRAVVFVDLQAGSCNAVALSCCRDATHRAVLCGVNLPVLLDFVFHRDRPLDEIVDRLVEKGRSSIATVTPKT